MPLSATSSICTISVAGLNRFTLVAACWSLCLCFVVILDHTTEGSIAAGWLVLAANELHLVDGRGFVWAHSRLKFGTKAKQVAPRTTEPLGTTGHPHEASGAPTNRS